MIDIDNKYWERLRFVEVALFGVDNFHETESFFGSFPGVVRTKVGYRTGQGKSQAASCVEIQFDPNSANLGEIYRAFWFTKSSSKRSAVIFYFNARQRRLGQSAIAEHFLGRGTVKTWDEACKDKRVKNFHNIPAETYNELERKDQKYNLQKHKNLFAILGLEKTQNLIRTHYGARLNGFLNGYGELEDFNEELASGKLKLTRTVEQAVRMKMSKPVNNSEVKFMKKAMEKDRIERKIQNKKEDAQRGKNINDMDKFMKKREGYWKEKEGYLAERNL